MRQFIQLGCKRYQNKWHRQDNEDDYVFSFETAAKPEETPQETCNNY